MAVFRTQPDRRRKTYSVKVAIYRYHEASSDLHLIIHNNTSRILGEFISWQA
ncbi:hypothetical protein LZZ85_17720 [Terrimonas sp. NA20]|uniref:Uncharacterized protein n=1 Tax=Terrimonas ginsenosidimutans TaxID=2908004 RepID=A0ABS9KV12_9BACT|nr:hypothetical protein [Terrimonas ginsenosidimutans]MCG2616140.1 hypothetical protein [Terrimonas ginsenosidimutans]